MRPAVNSENGDYIPIFLSEVHLLFKRNILPIDVAFIQVYESTSGLKPGEKLYEELLIEDTAMSTSHPRIKKAAEQPVEFDALKSYLKEMESSIETGNVGETLALLSRLPLNYVPNKH